MALRAWRAGKLVEVRTTIVGLFMFLLAIGYGLATWRSVIKPKPENHLHWYDRVLRAIGALMFVAIFVIRSDISTPVMLSTL